MGSMPEHVGHHNTQTPSNLYRNLTQHSMPKLCIFTHNWIGLGNAATRYFWLLQDSAGDLTHTHTHTYIERMNCLTHYLLVCLYHIYFSTLGIDVCFNLFSSEITFPLMISGKTLYSFFLLLFMLLIHVFSQKYFFQTEL